MKTLNQQLETLSSTEAQNVTGGVAELPTLSDPTTPITPVKPPRYFTLAIGEGGGDLPDLF